MKISCVVAVMEVLLLVCKSFELECCLDGTAQIMITLIFPFFHSYFDILTDFSLIEQFQSQTCDSERFYLDFCDLEL
jgi:hypothetical protein